MKFLTVLFSLILTFSVHAGLITDEHEHLSYNTGDMVAVDLFINNLNPDISFFQFDYNFNPSEFIFDDFQFTDDVWNHTSFFTDADGVTFAGVIAFNIEFLDDWSDTLGTSFKLGQAIFTADLDSVSPSVNISNIYAEDALFNPIAEDKIQVEVPEPAMFSLFALFCSFMFIRRHYKNV